jgi:hypothetical protein
MENLAFTRGELIWCQSYHGNYVCSCARVAMLDGDGTTSSTQVPVVRCAWVHVGVSCHARHEMSPHPEDLAPVVLI